MLSGLTVAERLDRADTIDETAVAQSPLERGTDPLGDDPLPTHGRGYQRTGQLVIACILGIVFAALAISDLSDGHVLRGLLAVVVAVLCVIIAVKERAKPKRPKNT